MYNGIEINEGKLLTLNIVCTFILLFTVAVGVVAFFVFCDPDRRKNKKRIDELRDKAEINPYAKKRLRKMERQMKRRGRDPLLARVGSLVLTAALIVLNLAFCVIPGWTDYIVKDYAVYGGSVDVGYEVHRYTRNSFIVLEDGTRLSGALSLDDGTHNARIVYAKRSKIVLGVDK